MSSKTTNLNFTVYNANEATSVTFEEFWKSLCLESSNTSALEIIDKELGEYRVLYGTTLPASAKKGQLFIETSSPKLYQYNGTSWQEVAGGGGEPAQYLKDAAVNANTLTITKKDGSTVSFTPDYSSLATKTELQEEATRAQGIEAGLRTDVDSKSTVSVNGTGTSTTEVSYITIDGTEYKLAGQGGGGSPAVVNQKTCENGADHNAILEAITVKKQGDIAIIKEAIDGTVSTATKWQYTAYVYSGSAWAAMDGNYNANNVYLEDNIKLAGEYEQVGNITKAKTETKELETKGKSVSSVLQEIFTKRLQPTNVTLPVVTITGTQGNEDLEIGTNIHKAGILYGSLSAGSYPYGPATGITAQSYASEIKYTAGKSGTIASGTTTATSYDYTIALGEATVSVNFKYDITHNEGAVAKDNLGDPSNPEVKIPAGTKSKDATATYTSYRKMFYGTRTDKTELTSAKIRSLSGEKQAAKTVDVAIPVGALRTIIAVPSARTVTSIKDVNGMGAEILSSFTQTTLNVEGANGYSAIQYKIYYMDYADPYTTANTYKVTIA